MKPLEIRNEFNKQNIKQGFDFSKRVKVNEILHELNSVLTWEEALFRVWIDYRYNA